MRDSMASFVALMRADLILFNRKTKNRLVDEVARRFVSLMSVRIVI